MSDDDEDIVLSQALDDIERSQAIKPQSKMLKLDFKRHSGLTLNMSRFKNPSKENTVPSAKASTSSVNEVSVQEEIETISRPIENQILCTISDDEIFQKRTKNAKLSTKTLNILNSFEIKENIRKNQFPQQQNVEAVAKSDDAQTDNDSAYDTMLSTNLSSASSNPASCKITGKTPALFAISNGTQNKIDEDDLSYLDTLEFV